MDLIVLFAALLIVIIFGTLLLFQAVELWYLTALLARLRKRLIQK